MRNISQTELEGTFIIIQTKLLLFSVTILTLICSGATAQQSPEFPGPDKEHKWLHKFVGEWTTTSKASMGPDQPPMECDGTIESRMIGEFWVINEMQGNPQGMPMRGVQTMVTTPKRRSMLALRSIR